MVVIDIGDGFNHFLGNHRVKNGGEDGHALGIACKKAIENLIKR